eukprot:scaffold371068_cov26-Attheya_sp.AAC.1
MERLESRSILIGLIFVLRSSGDISFPYFGCSGLLFEGDQSFKKTLQTAHVKHNVPRFIVLKMTTIWNNIPGTSRSKASYVKVLVIDRPIKPL